MYWIMNNQGITVIVRKDGNGSIPTDPGNRDYQEYLVWIEQGNVADPFPMPAKPDWNQFRSEMRQSRDWRGIANADPLVAAELIALLWQVGKSPSLFGEVKILWDELVSVAQPASQAIANLTAIAENNNMPFTLSETGQLIPLST